MAQATDPQKMTCPTCRKVTTLPDGDLTNLPPNFFMDNLKELITKETGGDEDEMKVTASADREVVFHLKNSELVMLQHVYTSDMNYLCTKAAVIH